MSVGLFSSLFRFTTPSGMPRVAAVGEFGIPDIAAAIPADTGPADAPRTGVNVVVRYAVSDGESRNTFGVETSSGLTKFLRRWLHRSTCTDSRRISAPR